MGLIQLLASLWPFLKEMFIGDKIKDSAHSKSGDGDKSEENKKEAHGASGWARWAMDKMQGSRRFLATVLMILLISLFVNYKVIGKLAALVPSKTRDEEQVRGNTPPSKEPKEVPTIPRKDSSERDVLFEQTVRELKNLYGVSQ